MKFLGIFILALLMAGSAMGQGAITHTKVQGTWSGNDPNGNAVIKWVIEVCVDGPTDDVHMYAPYSGGETGVMDQSGDSDSPVNGDAMNCQPGDWSTFAGGSLMGSRTAELDEASGRISPSGGLDFTSAGCARLAWTTFSRDLDSSGDDEDHYIVAEACVGCDGSGLQFNCSGEDSQGNSGCLSSLPGTSNGACTNLVDCHDVETHNYEQILGLSFEWALKEDLDGTIENSDASIIHCDGSVVVGAAYTICHHGESDYIAGYDETQPGEQGAVDITPDNVINARVNTDIINVLSNIGTLDSFVFQNCGINTWFQPNPAWDGMGNNNLLDPSVVVPLVNDDGSNPMMNNTNKTTDAACGTFVPICDTLFVRTYWTPQSSFANSCPSNYWERPTLTSWEPQAGYQNVTESGSTANVSEAPPVEQATRGLNPDPEDLDCGNSHQNTCVAGPAEDCSGDSEQICYEISMDVDKNITNAFEDATDANFFFVDIEFYVTNTSANLQLHNVNIIDDLSACMGAGVTVSVPPAVDVTVDPGATMCNTANATLPQGGFPTANASYSGYGADTNILAGNDGIINPGDQIRATVQLRVPVDNLDPAGLENCVSVTATDPNMTLTANASDTATGILPTMDLALSKTNTNTGPVFPGQQATFEITVENQGDVFLDSIEVCDYLPSGYTFVPGMNTGWVQDMDTICYIHRTSRVGPGGMVTIPLTLTLNGGGMLADYTNVAEISEAWDTLGLARGNQDIDSEADRDPDNDNGGLLDSAADGETNGNGMDPSGTPGDGNAASDEDDSDPAAPPIFDLALNKTIDPVSLAAAGGMFDEGEFITYFVTVFNQGNTEATDVVVRDTFPCGLRYRNGMSPDWTPTSFPVADATSATATIASIPAGGSVMLPIVFSVRSTNGATNRCNLDPAVVPGQPFKNYAFIDSAMDNMGNDVPADIDSEFGSFTTEETDTPANGPGDNDLDSPDNTSEGSQDDNDPANIQVFDLALSKILTTPVPPNGFMDGNVVTFEICVTSQGNVDATEVTITDYVPSGLMFDMSYPNNGDWSLVGGNPTIVLENADLPGGRLMYGEQVCIDLDLSIVGWESDYVNIAEISGAEGRVPNVNGVGFMNVPFTSDNDSDFNTDPTDNAGGAVGTGSDAMTSSTTDPAILGDGMSMPGDTDAATDEDNADPALVPIVDFALKKEITENVVLPLKVGDPVPFRIVVFNQGNITGDLITVTDYVPDFLNFDPVDNPGWQPMTSGSGLSVMNLISTPLAPGDSDTLDIVLTVLPDGLDAEDYTNQAEIFSAIGVVGEPFGTTPIAQLDTDSTIDTDPTNDNGADASSANSADNPNPADDYVDGNGNDPAGNPDDGVQATDEDDADPALVQYHDVALVKMLDPAQGPVDVGETVTFMITVTNQGSSALDSLKISDYIPAGYDFVPNNNWVVAAGGACLTATVANTLIPMGGIAPTMSQTFPIELTISQVANLDNLTNVAEISGSRDVNGLDQDDDADSMADNIDVNDEGGVVGTPSDDVIDGDGTGAGGPEDPATDEDDSDPATVELILYSVGNQLWEDTDNNGMLDPGEMGIPGVEVHLHRYNETTMMCELIGTAVTGPDGEYLFDTLSSGDYIVVIPSLNFDMNGPLESYASSTGSGADISEGPFEDDLAAIDPDDDADNDDNGVFDGNIMFPGAVVSDTLTLGGPVDEPTLESGLDNDPDTDDENENLTVDFGFVPLHSIGNQVWSDDNNNGVIDPGEMGIDGVDVVLHYFDGNGCVVVETVQTMNGGYYLFDSLIAGPYVIEIPSQNGVGEALEGGTSSTGSGATDLTNGDYEDDSYAVNMANNDTNIDDNGVLNGNSSFLPGSIASDTILLGDIEPVMEGDNPLDTDNETSPANDNDSNLTIDFGIVPLHSIGNQVWLDTNNDGMVNDGETLVPGVAVVLHYVDTTGMMSNCVVIDTVYTDADGYYLFDSLIVGDYIVEIPQSNFATGGPLANTVSSTGSGSDVENGIYEEDTYGANGDNITNLDDNGVLGGIPNPDFATSVVSDTINLSNMEPLDEGVGPLDSLNYDMSGALDNNGDMTIDFGFVELYNLGNQVWNDLDNDGIKDPNEIGVPGVEVTLHYFNPVTMLCEILETVTTDENGYYLFDSLIMGDYIVELEGSNFAPGGPLDSYVSSTGSGTDVVNGTYEDTNAPVDEDDVMMDGDDNGVANLYMGPGFEPTSISSDTISLGGTEPTGEDPDNDMTGMDDENSNLQLDFGLVQLHSIGNQVWTDSNNNGIFDPGEMGIDGVDVVLHYVDASGCIVLETVQTMNGGFYLFDSLIMGAYLIEIPAQNGVGGILEGTTSSTGNGATDLTNGDYEDDGYGANPANGNTNLDDNGVLNGNASFDPGSIASDTIYLSNDEPQGEWMTNPDMDNDMSGAADSTSNLTVDFGFVPYYTIGNQVWYDANNNGILDDGEEPVVGIDVVLHYVDTSNMMSNCIIIETVQTDANGYYLFDSLIVGDYIVELPGYNFGAAGTFPGYVSSTGSGNGPIIPDTFEDSNNPLDPDNGTNLDDNGVTGLYTGGSFTPGSISSDTLTLGEMGGEPTLESGDAEDDGVDNSGAPDDQSNLTVDFGLTPLYSIGNQVWFDENDNGVIDGMEMGIDGVTVELHYIDENGVCQLAGTVVTANNGQYLFDSLAMGDYILVIPSMDLDAGGVLQDYQSTTGTFNMGGPYEDPNAQIDPDNNMDSDDNGVLDGNVNFVGAVVSDTLSLGDAVESLNEDPDNDNSGALDGNSNLTVDFGFVDKVYDVALTKQFYFPDDVYLFGDVVPMFVELVNQGNTALTNITVVDYVPAALTEVGATNVGWNFGVSPATFEYTDTLQPNERDSIPLNMILQPGMVLDDYINVAEVSMFEDTLMNNTNGAGPYTGTIEDIDSTPDDTEGNDPGGQVESPSDDSIDGDGKNGGGAPGDEDPLTDEDDQDPLLLGYIDVALTKAASDPQVLPGGDITFTITVINQGTIPLCNILVTDYIPAGFTLNDPAWSPNANGDPERELECGVELPVDGLPYQEEVDITITITADDNVASGAYINYSEVTSMTDPFGNDVTDQDIDSQADDMNDNDPGGAAEMGSDDAVDGDGNNGGGAPGDTDPDTDEDDHDPAGFCVTPQPTIEGDFFVCADDVMTYTVTPYNPVNTYTWTVNGAIFTDHLDGSITVQFPDNPGGLVTVSVHEATQFNFCFGVASEVVQIEDFIAVACNDDINVSIGNDCTALITTDMVLEGQIYPDDSYTLVLTDAAGNVIPGNILGLQHVGTPITATIVHDCSGNSCWGTINLEDKNGPSLECDCPPGNTDPDCEYVCTDLDAILAGASIIDEPIITGGCTGFNLGYQDQVIEGATCSDVTLERTWYVTNANGQITDQCLSVYTITPISVNDIIMPEEIVTLGCGQGTSPENIVNFFDNPNTFDNGSTPTIENNEGIPYGFPYFMQQGHPQPVDNRVCDIFAVYSDQLIEVCAPQCSNNSKIARTWTLLDWCTQEQRTFSQIIDASDKEAPTVSGVDITVSTSPWDCVAFVNIPAPTLLHDNCSNEAISWYASGPSGWDVLGLEKSRDTDGDGVIDPYVFTYYATDCCGNIGSSEFNVTVQDLAAPTAVALQNIVVSLTGGQGSANEGSAKLYASAVNNGSHDNCGLIKLEVRRPAGAPACGNLGVGAYNNNETFNDNGQEDDDARDTDGGHFVKFCCGDAVGLEDAGGQYGEHQVILRVYDDANMDGVAGTPGDNYNETWATVRVENKLPPVINCQNTTIECWQDHTDPSTVPVPTTSGICGAVDVVLINTIDQTGPCGDGIVIKNWGVDSNGDGFIDGATCSQIITLTPSSDTFDGTIQWPSDVTTGCIDDTEVQKPNWNEGACDQIAWSHTDEVFNIVPDACWKVLRHYTVLNWCTNEEWKHTQILKYQDDVDPVLDCADRMVAADALDSNGDPLCGSYLELTKTVTDPGVCPSGIFDWYVTIDLWEDGSIDWIFTTGQAAYQSTTDNILPLPRTADILMQVPELVDESCFNHRIDYVVNDGCGNTTSCTEHFIVVDKKAPTPYCVNVSTAVMENGTVALWASDFDLGGTDDCTDQADLRFTFTDVLPPVTSSLWNADLTSTSQTFTCADADANGNVSLLIYIWDASCTPNSDFCEVTVKLSDCINGPNNRVVAGSIATETGDAVANVNVTIDSDAIVNYPLTDVTDTDGAYAFASIPVGFDFTVAGSKDDDYMNGVSTLDLLLIQKHILGLQDLDSPYKMIAADINSSKSISAIDLVELRKLILGIFEELPGNDSWRFVDASQALSINDPWSFVETRDLNDLQGVHLDENFVGVKIGDVNGNVIANATSTTASKRSTDNLSLVIDDQSFEKGDKVEVKVYAESFKNISGFQYTLSHPGLSFADVSAGAIEVSAENVGAIDESTSTMSWNATDMKVVADNDVLFTITYTAMESGNVVDQLATTSTITRAEAYRGTNYEQLGITMAPRGAVVATSALVLMQNEPNPFSKSTIIKFVLPQAGEASISIMDVSGKAIKVIRDQYNAGVNEIILTNEDITTHGVHYYKIEAGNDIAIKKMIVIK